MTRIQFQTEQQVASLPPSSDLNRQSQVSVRAFRALLALELDRYLQSQGSLGRGEEPAASSRNRRYATVAALASGLAQARWTSKVLPHVQEGARSAGIAAYRAHGLERFAQLKPYFLQAEKETGVPWQIQAAQWALETGWGRYTPRDLVTGRESHNLFGVKGTGPAGSVTAPTMEYVDGRMVQTTAQFRAYHSDAESILEHARLLAGPHYRAALACGRDLKAWTEMLGPQHLGYATDPQYSEKLWQIITENGWHLA